MFELIYYSSAKSNIGKDDITNILTKSRDFNSKNDITGFLLYHNNEFIQILEGDQKIIQDLYMTISKDDRHHTIRLVSQGATDKREFEYWKMGYYELTNEDKLETGKKLFIDNFIALSELVDKPTKVKKLFWYLSRELLMK